MLLKELKERFKLSWKQIADFFPDRKSGTLQVRYCTKIRKQDRVDWTDESVSIHSLMKLVPCCTSFQPALLTVSALDDRFNA